MALPINIEDLLNKCKVESNRIEFKEGWNPDKVYHSICAFANDIENTGGGYILIGVEEENGIAKRPVKGIGETAIDGILKDMVGFDAKISPSYFCKVSPENVDGKTILVIWVPSGINRPYSVMESVVAKKSVPKFYVRSKSASIEAKGEILDELRELANHVPFDERGNEAIKTDDISSVLVYDYLRTIGSKLAENFTGRPLGEILDEMDLRTGPTENRLIKNCAAMMFCNHPEKFFPVTQVDIVLFPEGSIENPDTMIEVPKIVGPVPKIIKETLSYLRTNVIKKKITKPADREKSDKVFNYPYQAFEEAVVNALYHRDYQEREPVEITVEPTHIDILSYAGPDRSISAEAIKAAKKLKARRYRNRRLGDFLKELDLTEGRATGIPTIQKALRDNGSEAATIETDDNRTYFLLTIPCHQEMIGNVQDVSKSEVADSESIRMIASKLGTLYVQDLSKPCPSPLAYNLAVCLTRCQTAISAKDMLLDIENIGFKQLRRKYLQPLLDIGLIEMTNPDKPTSGNQAYRLTEKGVKLF